MRRMNGPKAVAVCAGLLLPLPLLLLWALLHPEVFAEAPPGGRISPMLTHEQRMRLVTYGQYCGPEAACEPPLGCLFDARYPRSTCTDSQCLTNEQCREGEVCQSLATQGNGPQVRVCVPIGPRKEGEGCVELPRNKENACEAGLLCGGRDHGWCARPCRLDGPRNCPENFFCADTLPHPLCLPTCERRQCPAGQHCISLGEGASVCARIHGPNCLQTPCPDGRECDVAREPPHPGEVWMECVEKCGEGLSPCSDGKVCDGWHCLPACAPHGPPDACGEGYHCSRSREDGPFSCQPRYWDWTMGI
ncbi:hypothetical protein SAMN05444354_101719 [Stigmatella aurantiaca]|uniref:Uncharacterized protein n=1 Tax=Stigmatella aurantiaca TaxID=41 RepID=A0A1H7HHN3_STIAU|nr:hypothetical protein SAMN05444354_101719 [Stigmatella aurantiaca]